MAKTRMVNTRFWIDDYISNLDPIEKLLFLYFLTNPSTDISGVYEVPLKTVAVDTGIEKEMVMKVLRRFKRDKKIFYEDGWVAIKNFGKHQNLNNASIASGVEAGLSKAPKSLKELMLGKKRGEGDESSGVGEESSHLNLNPNLNPNPNTNVVEQSSMEIAEIIKLFEEINPLYTEWFGNRTQRAAVKFLLESVGRESLEKVILKLPEITSRKFAPKITTPFELKRDWAKLNLFIKQEGLRSTDRIIL
jgi:hypothetical protein